MFIDYVISKVSGQQEAIKFGGVKSYRRFF